MNEELTKYLDGELDVDELTPELRREAEVWDEFLADVRASGADGAPVGLESRVLDAIQADGRPPWSRLVDWWVSPHTVRVRPLIGLAAAAVLATLFLLPGDRVVSEPPGAATALVGDEVVYVPFVLEAPDARSVAVAGDFSEWEPALELSDADGDGVWTGRLMLPPGVHKYMFKIDGQRWITDPRAERYVEDGFGNRNAVIAITGGAGARSLAP